MTVWSRLGGSFRKGMVNGKPRILMLADYRGWAFDISARQIARELSGHFDFEIKYVNDRLPKTLDPQEYGLIYVFFWGERQHCQFGFDPSRTIKEISSHRWQDDPRFGPCSPEQMAQKFLTDSETWICTSKRLQSLFSPLNPRCFHTPNGFAPNSFFRSLDRAGPLTFGWAGNIKDPVKGVNEVLKPACDEFLDLRIAPGDMTHSSMNDFYNQLDVFVVASKHEGEPLTLLEAMAAGCFPVCTDVGIVPELVESGRNGIIVEERTPAEFRRAFQWCRENPDHVREAGRENAMRILQQRNWSTSAQVFKQVFEDTLTYAVTRKRKGHKPSR